jgi:hypothetical protein
MVHEGMDIEFSLPMVQIWVLVNTEWNLWFHKTRRICRVAFEMSNRYVAHRAYASVKQTLRQVDNYSFWCSTWGWSKRSKHVVVDNKNIRYPLRLMSRDSIVGIATGYGLDDREVGVRVQVGLRIFSTSSRPALGPTQPPMSGTGGCFPGGKAAGAWS